MGDSWWVPSFSETSSQILSDLRKTISKNRTLICPHRKHGDKADRSKMIQDDPRLTQSPRPASMMQKPMATRLAFTLQPVTGVVLRPLTWGFLPCEGKIQR